MSLKRNANEIHMLPQIEEEDSTACRLTESQKKTLMNKVRSTYRFMSIERKYVKANGYFLSILKLRSLIEIIKIIRAEEAAEATK